MSVLEILWDQSDVGKAVEFFGAACKDIKARAAYAKVGSSEEVIGLRFNPNAVFTDAFHITFFLDGSEGMNEEVLQRREQLHSWGRTWLLSSRNKYVDVHPVVLPYHMDGKTITTVEDYLIEFHMFEDHQKIYPQEDQAPR